MVESSGPVAGGAPMRMVSGVIGAMLYLAKHQLRVAPLRDTKARVRQRMLDWHRDLGRRLERLNITISRMRRERLLPGDQQLQAAPGMRLI